MHSTDTFPNNFHTDKNILLVYDCINLYNMVLEIMQNLPSMQCSLMEHTSAVLQPNFNQNATTTENKL